MVEWIVVIILALIAFNADKMRRDISSMKKMEEEWNKGAK